VSEHLVSEYLVRARSPIPVTGPVHVEAGWEVSAARSDAALTLTDCTPLAKVHLRAPWNGAMAKALGVPFGRAVRDGAGLVAGSGPGEWLVLAPPGTAGAVASRLERTAAESAPQEFVSVVDLTHGRALVRVTGPHAADLLARLCPIDLADDMTPDGSALRSSVAGVATDLIRDDQPAGPSYLLHCERSSGQYLHDSLLAAGESLGIGVDGFAGHGLGESGGLAGLGGAAPAAAE
jgi:heterotetrameric sarcosine oxidase gamma subunit